MKKLYFVFLLMSFSVVTQAQLVLEDAESNLGYYGYVSPGSDLSIVVNPVKGGINSSDYVRKYTRPGATDGSFASMNLGFDAPLTGTVDISTNNQVKIKVYAPNPIRIQCELKVNGNAASVIRRFNEVTASNQWQELSFDFSAVSTTVNFNRLAFLFDVGTNNTGTYYLDDIKLDAAKVASHITSSANGGIFYTNLSAVDIADNNNASDLKVDFKKAIDETYINGYRIIVVKESKANAFTLANATALTSDKYVQVTTGTNYSGALSSTLLDSDGEIINNSTTVYKIFVLSVAKLPATIDKLSAPSNAILNCTGTPTTHIFDNAECQRNITYTYLSGQGYLSVVPNPASDAVNSSAYVLKYIRPGSSDGNYSNIQAAFNSNGTATLDLSKRNIVKIKVFSTNPTVPVSILCQLNNNTIQQTASITAANVWQELTFDFSAQAANTSINKLIFLISPNTTNASTYFLDDIRIVTSEKVISSFNFTNINPVVNATINETDKVIEATVPHGTNLTSLVASYESSLGSVLKVNNVEQVSGQTANDFTSSLVYTVTAEDGSTVDYTVSVIEDVVNGVKSSSDESLLKVFPTASEGIFNLEVEKSVKARIYIYNSNGKIMLDTEAKSSTLNLTNFSDGVYFVKLQDENNNTTVAKIFKQ
jgi:hypothetical protein